MSDDDERAESSLLRTQHHTAQREHSRQHHQRLHRALQNRKRDDDTVTEIVATISIIKQISVDLSGNTIGIETIQTHLSPTVQPPAEITGAPLPTAPSYPESPQQPPPSPPSPPVEPPLPPSPPAEPPSSPSPPVQPIPTEPAVSQPTPSPPTPSEPPPSETLPPAAAVPSDALIPSTETSANVTLSKLDTTTIVTSSLSQNTTLPSFTASLNSTSIYSILKNNTQTFSNTTRHSSTTLSRSSTSSSSLNLSSTLTSSTLLLPTTEGGILGAGNGVASTLAPSSTASAAADNNDDNGMPPTPVVVGGVLGSIAGAAVLIIAMLFLIRYRRKNKGMFSLSGGSVVGDARDGHEDQNFGAMAERRSAGFTIPATFASIANKRFSRETPASNVPAEPQERGFYRISGKKLPSVLQYGGDGYGGGTTLDNDNDMYRDSHAFFGGRAPPSPPLGSINRQSTGGIPIIRPSPARTPTQEQNPFFDSRGVPSPPRIPDHVGRSHVSQDGSHHSRFMEDV